MTTRRIFLSGLFASTLGAADSKTMTSRRAKADSPATADPTASFWKNAPVLTFETGRFGEKYPAFLTEVRSMWTPGNLYFLFTCPYDDLYMNPNPQTKRDTWGLWDLDVAEVFIGWDLKDIRRYKEFELSPQGEWIDLDVNKNSEPGVFDDKWNAGMESAARIDRTRRVWYGEMKIPFPSIDPRPPQAGREFRINLYRIQGKKRTFMAWQPTQNESFHMPEVFGKLRLIE
jgi:Carbohydrate family 9 binding domain-like